MAPFTDHVSTSFNKLLASLPAHDMDALRSCLVRVPLVRDQMLAEHGQPVDHAFFIERGVVSVISEPVDGEDGIQVAMIGREGMARLGQRPAARDGCQPGAVRCLRPLRAFVDGPGHADRRLQRSAQHCRTVRAMAGDDARAGRRQRSAGDARGAVGDAGDAPLWRHRGGGGVAAGRVDPHRARALRRARPARAAERGAGRCGDTAVDLGPRHRGPDGALGGARRRSSVPRRRCSKPCGRSRRTRCWS